MQEPSVVADLEPTGAAKDEVETRFFTFGSSRDRFPLRSGESLGEVTIAYETYGRLNAEADNAILVFHALTGSQHAAGLNRSVDGVGALWNEECQLGWWDLFIGPGRALDTDRFFVICANYLGGCYGSTGPTSIDPETGAALGGRFPRPHLADTVDAHVRLLDHLDIQCLWAVIGNSTGGLASLSLATRHPDRVSRVVPAASSLSTSVLQKVHNFEQILAIENDPKFLGGNYDPADPPSRGLSLARMISHKSFISLQDMERRSRSEIAGRLPDGYWYDLRSPLESYMLHQGDKLSRRFDANAYLRILYQWQTFDLLADAGVESYEELFAACRHQRYLVFSIDSDACFYPDEQRELIATLEHSGVEALYVTVHSEKGHDSFLLEPELYEPHLDHFLRGES